MPPGGDPAEAGSPLLLQTAKSPNGDSGELAAVDKQENAVDVIRV